MVAPILALQNARVNFGGGDLFRDISLGIEAGDRIALIGRNGSGKSTLLKALAGAIDLDGGERFLQAGTKVSYLQQQPEIVTGKTVYRQVAEGLTGSNGEEAGFDNGYLVDQVLDGVGIDGARTLETLSGGEARRVSLAEALVSDPDILLLDEPTNHLDIKTILWLERELRQFKGALLIISHDRQFLKNMTRQMFWLDRGKLRNHGRGFEAFEEWSNNILANEEIELKKLDKRIADETDWSRKGITARRARNEGRIRNLAKLRHERAERPAAVGKAKLNVSAGKASGKIVIEANEISKSFPGVDGEHGTVIQKFSTRIMRGDRVAIIGPNGAGKTTLLNLLIGRLAPDSGSVTLGSNLTPAIFDQHRQSLDPEMSLWDSLADPGSGQLMVRGEVRHVVAYLRDFLFEDRQAKSPVKSLSGGEKNRLLLAKILARESNLLVLDEPTNDLDMETLDLLLEMLADYSGTLIIVSHDRDFIDKLVTSTIVVEKGADVAEYVGGYSDYIRQRDLKPAREAKAAKAEAKKPQAKAKTTRTRLSYKDQRDLDRMPDVIAGLERDIVLLERELADPELFNRAPQTFDQKAALLQQKQQTLQESEERWLEIEILQEEMLR